MLESHSHTTTSSFVETRGSYVFAVAARGALDDSIIGREVEPVEYVEHADLVALTSPIDLGEPGATGEMKERHFRTLDALMDVATHVPLRPGVTVAGPEAVRGFLDDFSGVLAEEMERLGDAAETVIRLRWEVDDPVAHLASKHEEFAELCETVDDGANPAEVARRVSQRYDNVIEYERRNHREVLYQRLAPHCREMRSLDSSDDRELARVRCLCGRDAFRSFEQELYEVADDLEEAIVFDVTEPAPPLSFLDDRLVY